MVAAQSLVDGWRDLGPVLWLVAGAGVAAWALLLALVAAVTRPRHVDPGPATLDLGGPESAAVVNLLTNDWRLGHEAVPATLLDLAARRVVAIDQVGEQTLITVRPARDSAHGVARAQDSAQGAARAQDSAQGAARAQERVAGLEPYERMVLDHVVHQAVDGVVPAEALTTGPEEEAKGWWRKFRRSVERDARGRGLSRRRWSPAVHVTLTVAALAVAAVVAVAATTLPDDPDDGEDDPVTAALAIGAITAGILVSAVEVLNGERDTPAGREAARRWLGLRELLAEDPLFGEYPPAGVAIWDRLLAFGATMGVAHGAVRALPLGTESDQEAWSSVGGHWRVVRIRYPRLLPPGYGRHPGIVVPVGLVQLGLAVVAFRVGTAAADAVRDAALGSSTAGSVPSGVDLGVSIGFGVVVAVAVLLAARGASMVGTGVADLGSGRHRFEGRVLRVRRRGDDERPRWYVAADDGTRERIRAWRVAPLGVAQGCTVRAEVTRRLAHVRGLDVVAPAPVRPALPDEDDPDTDAPPLSRLLGGVGSSTQPSLEEMTRPAGPPPPLPDGAAVSAAVGRAVGTDPSAKPHPLAADGRSVTFTAGDATMVQAAWVDAGLLQAHRSMPRLLRRKLEGVGDEAYRAVVGGGVVARRGPHVLMVMGRLTGAGDDERDRALEGVARVTLDGSGVA